MADSSASNPDEILDKKPSCPAMVFLPCLHMSNQRLLSTDCCTCCHENGETLNVPPLIETAGTWLSPQNPVNIYFLVVRIILMLFVLYCALFTFGFYASYGFAWAYFMYLTSWTVICTTALMILNVISTFIVYRMKMAGELSSETLYTKSILEPESHIYRIYMIQRVLFQIMVPQNAMVVLLFWTLVFEPSVWNGYPLPDKMSNIQLHGATCVALLIDYVISGQRLYYKSAIWAVLFVTVFTIWTIFFEFVIIENEYGVPYLYAVYNWSESAVFPSIVYFGTVVGYIGLNSLFAFIKKLILMYCSKINDEKNIKESNVDV
eukprot:143012_1